jgi:hypothetical protein
MGVKLSSLPFRKQIQRLVNKALGLDFNNPTLVGLSYGRKPETTLKTQNLQQIVASGVPDPRIFQIRETARDLVSTGRVIRREALTPDRHDLLDARRLFSVTEGQSYILRVRDLAKACGSAWLKTKAGGAG